MIYSVIINYGGIVQYNVKAKSKSEAKKIALKKYEKEIDLEIEDIGIREGRGNILTHLHSDLYEG